MTAEELYELLALPQEVAEEFRRLDAEGGRVIDGALRERLGRRADWPEAVRELQRRVGEDPDGLLALHELLLESLRTWEGYRRKGISLEIFAATMRFATRYLYDRKRAAGRYGFVAAWWFPRELAMQEFRLGALEFEMAEGEEGRSVEIHIPSDASLAPADVDASFAACRAFLARYYPDWTGVAWHTDSWMLSPVLPRLLPETSRILAFQRRFRLEEFNDHTHGAISWVFPGHREPSEDLQEDTTLQRRMMVYLLAGGCVGWARGVLLESLE